MTGTIPATFADLSNLTQLYLDNNRLSGGITNVIGLPKLAELDLSVNEFSGPIPPELGTQITLTTLLLGASPFTGEIPDELGNLTNLSELRLFSTQLTGTIPSSLGNLTRPHQTRNLHESWAKWAHPELADRSD